MEKKEQYLKKIVTRKRKTPRKKKHKYYRIIISTCLNCKYNLGFCCDAISKYNLGDIKDARKFLCNEVNVNDKD